MVHDAIITSEKSPIPINTLQFNKDLISALIGLARAIEGNEHKVSSITTDLLIKGILFSLSHMQYDTDILQNIKDRIHEEKKRLIPRCSDCTSPCGRNDDYDITVLQKESKNICIFKTLLLFHLHVIAGYIYHASCLKEDTADIAPFLHKILFAIGINYSTEKEIFPILQEVERATQISILHFQKGVAKTCYLTQSRYNLP